MDEVIIFGAGSVGKAAYHFYENKCNILCYVDNNEEKWGAFLYDKKIVSPKILSEFKGKVIIAIQNGLEQVEAELRYKYGIKQFLEFGVRQKGKFLGEELTFDAECIVMVYAGGLGNQLFQYSFSKYLELNGCNVVADITHYSYLMTRKFELNKLFQNIQLRYASDNVVEYYLLKDKLLKTEGINEKYIYVEPDIANLARYSVSGKWKNIKKGIVKGYFQTSLFADEIRDALLKCLRFPEIYDKKMQALAEEIKRNNSVSIHIRRGDYLTEKERRLDGICNAKYYIKAVKMIKEIVEMPKFYLFSDDILWCKNNIKIEGVFYVEPEKFEKYENWQDMYLMSICKHNIIANSSFSWWGAWLNESENKVVIAPRIWDNYCNLTNICPDTWIRI